MNSSGDVDASDASEAAVTVELLTGLASDAVDYLLSRFGRGPKKGAAMEATRDGVPAIGKGEI